MRAVIPGSMGTASYVVEGLGEPTSFASASHGAGRLMSRTEARKRIRRGDLERVMRRVVFDPRRADALVEAAAEVFAENAGIAGSDPAALKMLISGELDFFTLMGGILGQAVPVAEVQQVPFAFRTAAEAHAAATA